MRGRSVAVEGPGGRVPSRDLTSRFRPGYPAARSQAPCRPMPEAHAELAKLLLEVLPADGGSVGNQGKRPAPC